MQHTQAATSSQCRYCRFVSLPIIIRVILGIVILMALLSSVYDVFTAQKDHRQQVLISFSLLTNWKKFIEITSGEDKLYCINGIRVLSVGWIVLGNTLLYYCTQVPSINTFYIQDYVRDLKRMGIVRTDVAVDTFLLISGLFVSYVFLKKREKNCKFNIVGFYLRRYLRLTPPLAAMVLFSMTVLNHAGTGPLWDSRQKDVRLRCESNWWTTLIYVSNYVHPTSTCFSQTWYLSADMQLFFLSPLVLVPLWKNSLLGKIWITILYIAGLATTFTIVFLKKINASRYILTPEEEEKYLIHYHVPTHTRFSSWLVGVALGYIIHKDRIKKIRKLPHIAVALGWIVAMFLMIASVHIQYVFQKNNYLYDPSEAAFYLTLHRPAWALAVAWIIYACDRGYGGIVNTFFSSKIFQPLARLAYGVYLTHMPVIHLLADSARAPINLSDLTMMNACVGVLIMAIAWAIPLMLLFQSPVIAFENVIRGKENIEDTLPELPHNLSPPLPFRMPPHIKNFPEMTQINDEDEGPDDTIDVRL